MDQLSVEQTGDVQSKEDINIEDTLKSTSKKQKLIAVSFDSKNYKILSGTTCKIIPTLVWEEDSSLEETLTKAIKNGILSEYLQRKSSEVRNMLIAEYSYETDIEVQREEAFEEGERIGAEQNKIQTAKNMITMGLSLEQISQATDLSFEKVQQLAEEQEHK